MINPNHREYTRVAAGLGNRGQIREELPLSTRVHELAKELGLKSQELLERIHKWGLDVKANPLASLDPPLVDRIRELMEQPAGGNEATSPAAPHRPGPAAPAAPAPAAVSPRVSDAAAGASRPMGPAAAGLASASVVRTEAGRGAGPTPSASVASSPTAAAPQRLIPGSSPSASARPPVSNAPASPPASLPPSGPRPAPTASAPLSRPGGFSGTRPAGGPLSAHTTHRGAGPRPGGPTSPGQGPRHEPRPGQPGSQTSSSPGSASTGFQPLKRDDYMSSAGTRPTMTPRVGPSAPSSSGPRRPGGDSGGDGGRRDMPRGSDRPLPKVAAPTTQMPRTGGPQRTAPAAPMPKTQRPEKSVTREEMLALMKSGGLNAFPPPGGPGGGARGGQPQRALGPSPGQPRGGPAVGAGAVARRPAAGPGSLAPAVAPMTTEEEEDKKGKTGRLGSAADRAGRRARRSERAVDRRVTSPVPAAALLADDDDTRRTRSGVKKSRGGQRIVVAPSRKSRAEIEPPITIRGLSLAIGVKANDLIRKLMGMNQLATINASLDDDVATMLALEFGIELEVVHARTAEDDLLDTFASSGTSENLMPRPPVITILGHVDHGKTSLLDRIRKSNVVDSESGGITQHIGAYQVESSGRPITFVDTPGHEAFTSMRARGANVTDIVVLVVAADDGVMPQTVEAIAHAKAAGVPIVVALNKIDLPNVDTPSNINKIYGELSQQGLNPVEWGGDTEIVKTSASTGLGIPDLLATLETIAELHELKADPTRPATGTCLEASLSEGRGVLASVLVQDGTLRVGDVIVCGDGFGRVRALFNDKGKSIEQAGPSTPVEISGLDVVPSAGENFGVIDDISRARDVAETRRVRARDLAHADRQAVTLENLYSKMAEQKLKSLNLILKADVQGSLEALMKELEKLENEEVPIRVLLKAVGGISESDIVLADASQAIVIGFRVAPEDRAVTLAEDKKIEIRRYDIIYQVTDDIKKAVEGMLIPEVKEVHLGRAVVRQVFKISKVGAVAGCFVTQGTIERSAKVRLIREGREIYKGSIEALKRFKDDVKEVPQNFECGIKIGNFDDVKPDDVIEAYRIDIIRRTL